MSEYKSTMHDTILLLCSSVTATPLPDTAAENAQQQQW